MRDTRAHVNFEQAPIERERLIELSKASIDFTGEASAPKFRVRAVAHTFFAGRSDGARQFFRFGKAAWQT